MSFQLPLRRWPLDDRVVVLTGATGGLGQALATSLRGRGARVALLDLDGAAAEALAAGLGGPEVARGWAADVRSSSQLEAVFAEVAEHFGQIDIAIAGAGIGLMAPVETLDPDAFARLIDINLTGVFRTFQAAIPHVRACGGYLLAVSSMAAFVHSPLQAPYTASKAGVWALCDSLRLELRHQGVGVGSLHPTFFRTPMMDDVVADPAGRLVWGGNEAGLWKMTGIEQVTAVALGMIERRAATATVPRRLGLVGRTAWLLRPAIDRIGFRTRDIREAIALAAPQGWRDEAARERTGG